MLKLLGMIALGSALGGLARYGFSVWLGRLAGDQFPWGTLTVNLLGSILIGWVAAWSLTDGRPPPTEQTRLFLMVGVLGGFTTFSSFSLEALLLLQNGEGLRAGAYVLGSVVLCLAGVGLGFSLGK